MMSKLANGHSERRAQRYVAWLFEISVVLAVIPLVVHGLLTASGTPIA